MGVYSSIDVYPSEFNEIDTSIVMIVLLNAGKQDSA